MGARFDREDASKIHRITVLSTVLRLGFAAAAMFAVAAIVYALSHGRVFLFPFVLILGVPLAALLRRSPPPDF